ncbi:MAG: molybdopterin-dependent oxidoreductase [Candidatus Acidiferrum sp.]
MPQSQSLYPRVSSADTPRRTFLKQSLISGSFLISGLHKLPWPQAALDSDALRGGSKVGVVPFADEGKVPMGQPLGAELDGRLFTDLSLLTPENPVTPTTDFYIRTRASKLLDTTKPWSIQLGGLIEKPITLRAVDVEKMARPMGLHLMECAGNSRSAHFGMLSVADWHGVPVQEILQEAKPTSPSVRILISGFDQNSSESRSSIPGASWIFTSEQLKTSGAFLATKMNGQPLTPDHGAPVRLLVPGWYGCACIKWVNEISFVPDDAPATSQMQEYASRTMQTGVPVLAQDYRPALIDLAAMPIRVEKWFVRGKIKFRVEGIQWGGSSPIEGLEIRFNPDENFVPVEEFQSSATDQWRFWSQVWTPQASGKYFIRLRPKSPNPTAQRLNSGYYERIIEITNLA